MAIIIVTTIITQHNTPAPPNARNPRPGCTRGRHRPLQSSTNYVPWSKSTESYSRCLSRHHHVRFATLLMTRLATIYYSIYCTALYLHNSTCLPSGPLRAPYLAFAIPYSSTIVTYSRPAQQIGCDYATPMIECDQPAPNLQGLQTSQRQAQMLSELQAGAQASLLPYSQTLIPTLHTQCPAWSLPAPLELWSTVRCLPSALLHCRFPYRSTGRTISSLAVILRFST